ncbi:Succinate dehydrogenase, cytochrome b subunit [Phaffia rhodozyma]|uniref:Succinate dehydrogenase, cytochrome b subunit n=1 Tax=Phaffia rhodozyma TaxID=264483 RepID=A0A0F7SQV8_PHARH|nr:Succinate dehydrogenase, cytochrome b subunit [Phaffia rhodozyma]
MISVSLVGRRAIPQLARSPYFRALPALSFRALSSTPRAKAAVAPIERLSIKENEALLNNQRLVRPSSPHFTIYQPQITWLASIANRVTGCALSGLLYVGAITYIFHPYLPWADSAHLIDLVSILPSWFKYSCKFILAVPFTFHSLNGIRHLLWDTGFFLGIKQVNMGGWVVVGSSLISGLALAMW